MRLDEIFNTRPIVRWVNDGTIHRGTFVLDGITYVVKADEWQLQLPGLLLDFLDVGFTSGESEEEQSLEPTNLHKASRVLGSVLNSVSPTIKRLNPMAILFGAQKSDKYFEDRMRVYERLGDLYFKSGYPNKLKGIETSKGSFVLLSKPKISNAQFQAVKIFIQDHIEPLKVE